MEEKRLTNEEFIKGQIEVYKRIKERHAMFEATIKSVDFPFEYEEEEQALILKEYHALEDYRDAMLRRMRYYKVRMKELASTESYGEEPEECSHCGQDVEEEPSISLKDLLGMEVVGVGKGKCDGCPMDRYQADCCKVELVGGDYICLAKPKPEEEDGDNVMGDIKEKAEEFIDYLDSMVGN